MGRSSPAKSRAPVYIASDLVIPATNYRLATTTTRNITDTLSDHSGQSINKNIEGQVSENTFEERKEILSFTEDSRVLTDSISVATNLPRHLIQHGVEPREHTVKNFLMRPEKIATNTWTTSAVRGAILLALPIPSMILTTMYREKLSGFGLLRATVVFKLQFNSQPFQAGRLIAIYVPVPGYLGDRAIMAIRSLQRMTALPNVLIDISKQTECNISCPYVSCLTNYDLTTGGGDWGVLYVVVYSPLTSASTQSVSITVRAHLEDVDLGAPTQKGLVSAAALTTDWGLVSGRVATLQAVQPTFTDATSINGVETLVMKEEKAGPISKIGHSIREPIAAALSTIGKHVPLIGRIGNIANGFAMSALNAFAEFGLGEPQNLSKTNPMVLNAFSSFACTDGCDNGRPVCVRYDNHVDPLSGFAGSDIDELSITYLAQTPQYIGNFQVSTTTTVGTLLFSTPMNVSKDDPDVSLVYQTNSVGPVTITQQQPSLQKYIASMFAYWRGDTILHFGFVKTDAHSLRIKVVFDPMAIVASDISYSNSEYCYSVVLDIREKTDFYIRIPFISTTPWKLVGQTTGSAVNLLDQYGQVNVYLDNVMQAASAVVSTSIDCVVEWCLADNVEFAVPIADYSYLPLQFSASTGATKATLQSGFGSDGIMKSRSSMQVETRDIQNITGQNYEISPQVNDFTVGETIHSLRCLIKIFSWTYIAPVSSIGVNFYNMVRFLLMKKSSGVMIPLDPRHVPTLMDTIGALFAFRRGGLRVKAIDTSSRTIVASSDSGNSPSTQFLYFNDQASAPTSRLMQQDSQYIRGSGEFSFPFYSPTYVGVNNAIPDGYQTADYYALFARPSIGHKITRTDTTSPLRIATAAADDTTFGFLLGVPDCLRKDNYLLNTSVVNPVPS